MFNKLYKNALLLTFPLADTPSFIRKNSVQSGIRILNSSSKKPQANNTGFLSSEKIVSPLVLAVYCGAFSECASINGKPD